MSGSGSRGSSSGVTCNNRTWPWWWCGVVVVVVVVAVAVAWSLVAAAVMVVGGLVLGRRRGGRTYGEAWVVANLALVHIRVVDEGAFGAAPLVP